MKKASSADILQGTGNRLGYNDRSLWLWVAAGFLLLGLIWSIMFTVARSAKIESVPLAASPGKP